MFADSNKPLIAMIHYAGPPIVGGVESTIFHHARLLAAAGYPVEMIAGRGKNFPSLASFHQISEIDSRHEEVIRVGEELSRGVISNRFLSLRDQLQDELRPILSAAAITIVHNVLTLHKNLPLTAALRSLLDERLTSWIAWCHDFAWQDPLYTPGLHSGYPWDLLKEPWSGVRYVTVSESRREALGVLLGMPTQEITVIPPGIDVARFLKLEPLTQELIEKLALIEADPLLLLPARITRRKNIEFAIRVTAAVQRKLPEVSLIITGPPGPHNPKNIAYLSALRELAVELHVKQQVYFLYESGENGQTLSIPDEVVADLYRIADILLFPSRREGFGIPILEAGLSRLPVFAADIPPFKESAGDLYFAFDPEGDPKTVADRIVDLLHENTAYRLRRRVIKKYSWQKILEMDLIPMIETTKSDENKEI